MVRPHDLHAITLSRNHEFTYRLFHSPRGFARAAHAQLSLLALLSLLFFRVAPSRRPAPNISGAPLRNPPCSPPPWHRAHDPRMPHAPEWRGPVLDTLKKSTLRTIRWRGFAPPGRGPSPASGPCFLPCQADMITPLPQWRFFRCPRVMT